MSCRFLTSYAVAALLLLSIALPARAATNWIHTPDQPGDWFVAGNWDGGCQLPAALPSLLTEEPQRYRQVEQVALISPLAATPPPDPST